MAMGFRFGRSQGMEGTSGNLREYAIDPANTNPIFTGDLVTLSGGFVQEATGAGTTEDTFTTVGIFWGCRYVDADGSYVYANQWNGGAGRSNIQAYVVGPSGATFIVEGDPAGGYTAADVGTRKGVIYGAGNTATGSSGTTLGAAGANVAGAALRVVQLLDIPEITDPTKQYLEVSVVNSQMFGTDAAP